MIYYSAYYVEGKNNILCDDEEIFFEYKKSPAA